MLSESTSDRVLVEPVEQRLERPDAAVVRHPQRERLTVTRCLADDARRRLQVAEFGELQENVPAGDAPLELVRGALGDDPAVVQHRDPVGELVGLVQVLGGEEDRHAVGHQLAARCATWHGGCAGRGRWSVRRGRSPAAIPPASWRGRAGAACRRSRWTRTGRPRRPGRTSPAARSVFRLPSARPRWCRSAISFRFSRPVIRLSTAENWPVTPIAARTASGSLATLVARDRRAAAVRADQRGQDLDHGGLAGAVRAEQREDGAALDVQVDALEHLVVAVGPAQPGCLDRGSWSSPRQERRTAMSPKDVWAVTLTVCAALPGPSTAVERVGDAAEPGLDVEPRGGARRDPDLDATHRGAQRDGVADDLADADGSHWRSWPPPAHRPARR